MVDLADFAARTSVVPGPVLRLVRDVLQAL
jgi:hypothetical protein